MSERSPKQRSEAGFILENQATRETTPVQDTITVGRGAERDVVLDCVKCSRFHAEFRMEDGQLWVEDQGSTNGTYVNGEKTDGRVPLKHGDRVQFGDARFQVIDLEQQPTQPDRDKTMIAGAGDLQGLFENPPVETPEGGAQEGELPGPSAGADAAAEKNARASSSSEPKPKPKPEAPEEMDRSIPRSWADAEQLEPASHTSMMSPDALAAPDEASPFVDPGVAIARAREYVAADCPILVGLNESVMGVMFELSVSATRAKWEIGRGEGADIEIDAESVSGRHCQLVHENGRWKIVNMMSANGTFVNERKVLSAYLKPGDVIRIGGIKLVFDAPVPGARRRKRTDASPAEHRSGIGRWITAPFRWLGRLFSRRGR